ncbi:MAG: hypothetical protein HY645_02500 [Acidobacteria bacterium]|nr:hypothetical protein [Acidobacteriota bacterium]
MRTKGPNKQGGRAAVENPPESQTPPRQPVPKNRLPEEELEKACEGGHFGDFPNPDEDEKFPRTEKQQAKA